MIPYLLTLLFLASALACMASILIQPWQHVGKLVSSGTRFSITKHRGQQIPCCPQPNSINPLAMASSHWKKERAESLECAPLAWQIPHEQRLVPRGTNARIRSSYPACFACGIVKNQLQNWQLHMTLPVRSRLFKPQKCSGIFDMLLDMIFYPPVFPCCHSHSPKISDSKLGQWQSPNRRCLHGCHHSRGSLVQVNLSACVFSVLEMTSMQGQKQGISSMLGLKGAVSITCNTYQIAKILDMAKAE